jgi:hypothetical protein
MKIVQTYTEVSRCVDCSLAMGKTGVRWEGLNASNLLYGVYICGREGEIVGTQVGQSLKTPRPLQGQDFHARGWC